MTITISPSLEDRLREKAANEGVTVEAYVEQLILDDGWDDTDFSATRSAVMEGLVQIEQGEARPARDVFADLRAKHGLPR